MNSNNRIASTLYSLVCLKNISINTRHEVDDDDDDDNNNNNNIVVLLAICNVRLTFLITQQTMQ